MKGKFQQIVAILLVTGFLFAFDIAVGKTASAENFTYFANVTVTLNQRLATRTGPGTQYDEPGSFLSAGSRVTALSKAYDQRNGIWWVQVEFSSGGNRYRAYTGAKRFDNLNLSYLPEERVLGYCFIPFSTITGYYGPSYSYQQIARAIPGRTDVDIIAVAKGSGTTFYQIEFYDSGIGRSRRAWVDFNDVSRDYFYDDEAPRSSSGSSGGSSYQIPQFPWQSYAVSLRNPYVERIRPQCGPGYNYAVFASMNGSTKLYNPRNITYLNVHFLVGDWAYIEFGYTDGVLRFGFFEKSLFDPSVSWGSVPAYTLQPEKTGTITTQTTPYNGPGTHCGSYSSCRLSAGSTVYACMESNGWYLCRFYTSGNNYGNVYLWVPGQNISWY